MYLFVETTVQCKVDNATFNEEESVALHNCLECVCQDAIFTCHQVYYEPLACEWSILHPGQCCPQCQGNFSINVEYSLAHA